ncbi:MAG: hypothetical protein Kow0079_15180 [Vicingaceae bacterium]
MKFNFIISCCQYNLIDSFKDILHEIIISLIGSIIIFIIIFFRERIFNYWHLHKFNGKYSGFDTDNNQIHRDKEYHFRYSFLNNKIKLSLDSKNKGKWIAYFLVDSSNPYVSISTFNYIENNEFSGNWGTIQIWLNNNQTEIVIESTSKNMTGKGSVSYLLKKNK